MKFSNTSKDLYNTCPYKWYLHYKKNYRSVRQGSALVFGTSFDLALNELLTNKNLIIASEVFTKDWSQWKDLPIIDFFKSDLDESLLNAWELIEVQSAKPELKQHLLGYYTLLNKGLRMLAEYEQNLLPEIKLVLSVQGEFTIPIPETEHTVGGKLDLQAVLQDDKKYIIDNKTTSTPYPKNSAETKEQTALYSIGCPGFDGVGFFTVNKKTFATQKLLGVPPKELQEAVIKQFQDLAKNIDEGKFDKNKKGCYSFGSKCQFYSHCFGDGFSEDIYESEKNI